MGESSYEEYKRNLSVSENKNRDFRRGKVLLVVGLIFGLYLLWILPFRAGNVGEMHMEEIKAGKNYYPQKVYYIENLQILHVKTDTDSGRVYCIAKFTDGDGNEWIVCATPGNDKRLAERLGLSGRPGKKPDLTVSGYFQLQYLEDLPFEADSFYSVYGRDYAEGRNMAEVNAKYLCNKDGDYLAETLLRPGIPLVSLVAALYGIFYGGFLLIRNRKRKEA